MAEKLEHGDAWLPSEFFDKGFFLEKMESGNSHWGKHIPNLFSRRGTECDEKDCIADLTRKMARSFLADGSAHSFLDFRDAVSPNSYSPVTASLERRKQLDGPDLLYAAAAGEVLRKKQSEQRAFERKLLLQMEKPMLHTKPSEASAGFHNSLLQARQQLQVAQFYKLKHQQLIKQQLSTAWIRHKSLPHSCDSSPWSPQMPSSEKRAILLDGSGTRRESAGTGVFIPRKAANPPRKKSVCSTALLHDRVVHALTLDDPTSQSRCSLCASCDHEMSATRISSAHSEHKRSICHSQSAISGQEIRLPNEWTY